MKKILTKENVIKELEEFTTIHPDTGCWIWSRGTNGKGYGLSKYSNKMYSTHRLSAWVYKNLDLEDPVQTVCHICDNTVCVNPEHLVVADQGWNIQDSYNKGRSTRQGTNNTRAKLSEKDVSEIQQLLQQGILKRIDIAKQYNVSPSTIGDIKAGRNWGHLGDDIDGI
jgi:hypothetical protein